MQTTDREPLPLEHLRLLATLLRVRRLTRAAEALGITVSAASRRLAHAREHFGDPLFIRSSAGLTPTDRMAALGSEIDAILEAVAHLGEPERFEPATLERTLRIMTADSGLCLFLLGPIARMRREAPGLRIEIQPLTEDMFRRLKDDRTDFLLLPRSEFPREFAAAPLKRVTTAALLRRGHPLLARVASGELTPEDLEPYGVIDVDPTAGLEGFGFRFAETLPARRGVSLPYFAPAHRFLKDSDDVLLIPLAMALDSAHAEDLALLRFREGLAPAFTPHLIWHRRIHTDPAMQWVRSQILAAAKG